MHIVLAHPGRLPATHYGGTERVIWGLGKGLGALGHEVTFLAAAGSRCDFARVCAWDASRPLGAQLPPGADVLHLHAPVAGLDALPVPHVLTMHGNPAWGEALDANTVFVSRDHAARHGSTRFVHNGLDWDAYGAVDLGRPRRGFHFLGNAAWRVKNVQGAISTVLGAPGATLDVLGGHRVNLRMGVRITLSPRVRFHGMVDDVAKGAVLGRSQGLVFPVRWPEPFGLAVIESLYFGCPVFGTPYGALPELVPASVGVLSASSAVLSAALADAGAFSAAHCHAYARDTFHHLAMAAGYVALYAEVLGGRALHGVPPSLLAAPPKFLPWS